MPTYSSTMTEKEFKARLKYIANAKKTVEKEKAAITAQVEILSAAQKELLEDDEPASSQHRPEDR